MMHFGPDPYVFQSDGLAYPVARSRVPRGPLGLFVPEQESGVFSSGFLSVHWTELAAGALAAYFLLRKKR
jgi:hypothetical protein